MTRTRTLGALTVTLAMALASPALANGHDSGPFREGCLPMTLDVTVAGDPGMQLYEGTTANTCMPDVRISGTAELWVNGNLVDSAQVDDQGRSHLFHLSGGETQTASLPEACIVFHGDQMQLCNHPNNDSPGHLKHAAHYPLNEQRCDPSVHAR